jgi:hypothetical protein
LGRHFAKIGRKDKMNLRNLFIMLWAIDRGGLPRIFALTGILVFIAGILLVFLSLVGGPGEILRYLHTP